MNKTFNFLALVLLIALFAFAYSAQAQGAESTAEPTPIVVVETPSAETPQNGDLSQFELVFASLFLVSLLFNAMQAWLGAKSIPPELAMQIFSGARLLANVTPNPDDNKLVDAGERFYQDLSALKQAPKVEPLHDPSENRS